MDLIFRTYGANRVGPWILLTCSPDVPHLPLLLGIAVPLQSENSLGIYVKRRSIPLLTNNLEIRAKNGGISQRSRPSDFFFSGIHNDN
ncbi:uncharacterized protein LOC112574550 isoform X2 [Pomacea canaliculata]|uniref:uncharacterized protein LOC112574550 isoform X2 n=1 Tax=Pomacea canaliculata TaxID=400727 RepID=UPI000D7329DB|nr:uncharacterized protein LOC112574550 isoform X2 [Pomacea canaliculata]